MDTRLDTRPDTRLDYMDHASYLAFRALGHHPTLHYTWVYDRAVDLDALRRLSDRLHQGRFARVVEAAPGWGGRPRWVRPDAPVPIEVEPAMRPRSQIEQWSVEVSRRPIDPGAGPPWRFGVLRLDDGGSAVAIVVSHTVTDGVGVLLGLREAVEGLDLDLAYPRRGERGRSRLAHWREVIGSLPEKVRALRAVVRQMRAERSLPHRASTAALPAAAPAAEFSAPDPPVRDGAARVVTFVSEASWDACAERLGGTSNVLASALAARLGHHLGRVQQNGTVNLTIPVSVREGDEDLRGNALSSVVVTLDPAEVTHDLRPARAAMKAALSARDANQLPLLAALPLVPFVPVWLLRRLERFALGADVNAVGCSNLGRVTGPVERIDGRPCQYAWGQFNEPGRPTAELARMGGQGFLGVTFSGGRVVINAVAFRPGGDNSDEALLAMVHDVIAEFGLGPPLPW
ncbi:hypothetical protein [Aeromicrobium choanae]|uniref:Diacylglycerol O-acyltransferase n=1 Tax=Aeromicrobium choanae TaxID=1736691 RepID=A0A1T4Z2J7_9ACTN|nr:hypothetical protein [Aeromicrobium choanae]SKB08093.1 hypothetical protein SAMN06295964_1997 [Aeromicrobium choanae]